MVVGLRSLKIAKAGYRVARASALGSRPPSFGGLPWRALLRAELLSAHRPYLC